MKFHFFNMPFAKGNPVISSEEEYLDAIENLNNPTFLGVRELSVQYWKTFMDEEQQQYFTELKKGKSILQNLQQCATYLYAYGKKHNNNLLKLFEHLPENLFKDEIDLIDWGCGQGLATMVLCDFLQEKRNRIRSVTLIEPSAVAIERAKNYIQKFLPRTKITALNQDFETLRSESFTHCICKTRLHLFANIIDVQEIDLNSLIDLLDATRVDNDYYLCLNPAYQGDLFHCVMECQHSCRFNFFTKRLNGKCIYTYCEFPSENGMQSSIIHK